MRQLSDGVCVSLKRDEVRPLIFRDLRFERLSVSVFEETAYRLFSGMTERRVAEVVGEAEALEMGRSLFAETNSRTPTLRCLLFVLQNRLNLPQTERWSVDTIFGNTQKARRDLALFAKNGLRFPITGIHEFLQQN